MSTATICPHCQWDRRAAPHLPHPEDGSCAIPVVDRMLAVTPPERPRPDLSAPAAQAETWTRKQLATALIRALETLEQCPDPRVVDGAPAFWEWYDAEAKPLVEALRAALAGA